MKEALSRKLDALRQDFVHLAGRPFDHFYCPILFRDDPVELVQGHVVNRAFSHSSPRWTVQRKDVDNFFGAHFESDFVVLEERGKHDLFDVLADRDLSRKLRPRVFLDGEPIEHYGPRNNVPESHSKVTLEKDGVPTVPLVLKVHPNDFLNVLDGKWEVEIRRNLTVPVLVALLKAAHLSLFEAVGYNYGLSAAGHFVGWNILGSFFDQNHRLDRTNILERAVPHFREFVNLVRPISQTPFEMAGTIDDGYIYLCTGTPKPWAMLVFVKAGTDFHGVLVPVLEDAEGAARFYRFLNDPGPRFEVKLAKFVNAQWEVSTVGRMIEWPAVRPEDLSLET